MADPFHALIECEILLVKVADRIDADPPLAPIEDEIWRDNVLKTLKHVREALDYLREHPMHQYVEPTIKKCPP